MANKTIAVHLPQDSGNTSLTIRLRAGSTIINTPDTLTETSSTGYFTATVTEANSAGWHSVDILSGATVRYAGGWVYLPGDTAGTYIVDEPQLMRGTDNALLASGYTAPTNLSAAQVRSELATELARIDVAISTRLATASYTAPANSDITAIKAKTDNLPATPASSTDVQLLAVQNISPTIERVNGDTDAIRFTWPVDSATITGEVSKNGGSYAAVVGAITQRTTQAGVYWYQLAHNAADRTLGSVRYKFTDGTRTRFVNLLVNPATASVDLQPVLDKLPESGRATTLTAAQVWDYIVTGSTSAATGLTTLLSRILGTLAAGTHQPQTGDSFARLGAPAGASIAADIAAIEGGGAGLTGDYTLTVTVTDADTEEAIEAATVTLFRTGERGVEQTDDEGVATFGVDAATWTYVVRAAGYQSATGTEPVSGNGTLAVELTAIVVEAPTNPAKSALQVLCVDEQGEPEAGVAIDLRIAKVPSSSVDIAFKGSKQTATSNANGIASFEAYKGGTYQIKRGTADEWETIVIGSGDVTSITSFIGAP